MDFPTTSITTNGIFRHPSAFSDSLWRTPIPLMDFSDNIHHNEWNFPTFSGKVNTCDGLFRFSNIYQNCQTFADIFLHFSEQFSHASDPDFKVSQLFEKCVMPSIFLRNEEGDKLFAIFIHNWSIFCTKAGQANFILIIYIQFVFKQPKGFSFLL